MVRVAAEGGVGAAGAPVAVTALQALPTQPVLTLTAPADPPGSLPADPDSTGGPLPAVKAFLRLYSCRLRRRTCRGLSSSGTWCRSTGTAHDGGGHQDQQQHHQQAHGGHLR